MNNFLFYLHVLANHQKLKNFILKMLSFFVFRNLSTILQSHLCSAVTLGKWQGDCYIQVNFADNIRQLKILGSCPVTVIYRVTAIYRSSLQKRQLKILGNCLVTVIYRVTTIYRAVVYRFDCIKNLLEALAECVLWRFKIGLYKALLSVPEILKAVLDIWKIDLCVFNRYWRQEAGGKIFGQLNAKITQQVVNINSSPALSDCSIWHHYSCWPVA